jgi:penicillin-binding protein 2
MVVMNEESGRLDTTEFCSSLGITKDFFIKRMNDIKDRSKNPGYSRFTQQLFMSQLSGQRVQRFPVKRYSVSLAFMCRSEVSDNIAILMQHMSWATLQKCFTERY